MDAPTSSGFRVALERAGDWKHASAPHPCCGADAIRNTPTHKGER